MEMFWIGWKEVALVSSCLKRNFVCNGSNTSFISWFTIKNSSKILRQKNETSIVNLGGQQEGASSIFFKSCYFGDDGVREDVIIRIAAWLSGILRIKIKNKKLITSVSGIHFDIYP